MRRFPPRLSSVIAALALAVACAEASSAQELTVTVEENFRASPNGPLIGTVAPGTPVVARTRDGAWTEVTVAGYVYVPSLQVWTEGDFDLVVSAEGGENLRAEPSGAVLGRFEGGALLEEVRRIPGWIEVRRTGWIWSASLDDEAGSTTAAVNPPPAGEPVPPSAAPGPTGASTGPVAPGNAPPPLLAAPDGATLATLDPGAPLQVLDRDGDWARVRLEGWVWVPGLSPGATLVPPATLAAASSDDDSLPGAEVSVADLVREPGAYEGRVVELVLEFISLERAEPIRSGFYEGEPFLLTRSPDQGQAFVYVAVPTERLAEVEGFAPLETIRVSGRVRPVSGRTGNPTVDLVSVFAGP